MSDDNTNGSKKVKSHKEAERRRRERINGHYSTFRNLVPNGDKLDKASLLAEIVRKVKELKKLAAAAVASQSSSSRGFWAIPNEKDELTVDYYKDDLISSEMMIRVSFSCEDRVDLLSDLIKVLKKSAQGKVVRAEISTIGGRTKSVILIQPTPGSGVEETRPATSHTVGTSASTSSGGDGVTTLRRALKPVINKPPAISPYNKWFYT
ncbi:Myc-type [Macleaya cordata]|uniref:Myc-type n=1 Tax=Macleaya cordata TaxID=56857 RepID=A0A200PNK8_MACCD|nr:Myc-type [Macleaya cordata]